MRLSLHPKRLGALAGIAPVMAAALAAALGAASPALAAGCPPPPPNAKAFAPWGDSLSYVPVNGGSFAANGPGAHDSPWTLSGGASIVTDNDPSSLGGPGGFGALSLPSGGSAVSQCTTAPMIKTIVRFFVKNTGSPTGRLHVEVLVNGGKNGVLDGGTITAGPSWAPSPAISVPWPKPLNGAVDLRVRLTAVGTGASFEVDDVYLDPCRSR